jgi:nucleoid DNA-binding protein
MAKTEVKTKVNDASVTEFLNSVADEQKRKDCFEVLKMMKQVTREEPKMWGTSIVGFGSYHYKGKSGREGDWMLTGFSPRKQNLTLYLMGGFDTHIALLKKLGKFTTGAGCLYIKRLDDVDKKVLKELVQASVKRMTELSK